MLKSIYGSTGLRRPETYPVGRGKGEFNRTGLRLPETYPVGKGKGEFFRNGLRNPLYPKDFNVDTRKYFNVDTPNHLPERFLFRNTDV